MTLTPAQATSVVISVPHDGLPAHEHEGFFNKRVNGIRGRDLHTWAIAKDIALHAPVHIVRGMLHRSFIDYNRGEHNTKEPAYDDERLKRYYDAYHETLGATIGDLVHQFGEEQVLLIDLHGFANQPSHGTYDLIYGTCNRRTVRGDIDRQSAAILSSRGYTIFVPQETPVQHDQRDRYSGGFITKHYAKEFGINALQIEVAAHYRRKETATAGKHLATDLDQALIAQFSWR